MRFLISARVPTQKTNALIQEGRFPQTFQSIVEDLQPETAYFTDMDGARGAYFVVNVEEPSEMASKTETLLQGLGAEIRIQFVWTPEDYRWVLSVRKLDGSTACPYVLDRDSANFLENPFSTHSGE